MKLLDGRDVAGFVQERQAGQVRALAAPVKLAIVREGATPATDTYLRVKQRYGEAIGIAVDTHTESSTTLLSRVQALGADPSVSGIIVQLPLETAEITDEILAAIPPAKDVDGLGPKSAYEPATAKAILWLLAAYNIDLKTGRIAVVGQGRLVGRPLADMLEASGCEVVRADEHTKDLGAATREADIIITATGHPGLITGNMVKPGAVVVDAGSPQSDLAPELFARGDLKVTPNPGGVGPMTVAALFDNLLIAVSTR